MGRLGQAFALGGLGCLNNLAVLLPREDSGPIFPDCGLSVHGQTDGLERLCPRAVPTGCPAPAPAGLYATDCRAAFEEVSCRSMPMTSPSNAPRMTPNGPVTNIPKSGPWGESGSSKIGPTKPSAKPMAPTAPAIPASIAASDRSSYR